VNRVLALALALFALALLAPSAQAGPALDAYRGTGAWIDIYDPAVVFEDPYAQVAAMRARGAGTLYIETGNWRALPATDVVRRTAVAAYVDAAHAAGMRAVAWYLPGFTQPQTDLRRVLAAIRMRTPAGGRFDSFALDIEATLIRSLPVRNRAMLAFSRRLRRAVGPDYPLGAIVPDQRSSTVAPGLWPYFPYRAARPYYDAFLPMAYSTVRAHGAAAVYGYVASDLRFLRAATGDPRLPVHVIGGVTPRLRAGEAMAVARAARDGGAIGASFYSWAESGPAEWSAMGALAGG
jgi:hypothetical protein